MRAAVLRGGRVETRIIDDPVPGPGQLLVRSLACGICASDLHFMDHPEAGADDDSGMSTYDQDASIVMGHEYCAEVVDYGPGTEHRIPVGTRVSSLPVLATAAGRKIIGQNPESPGGFGDYLLLTEAITRVVVSDLPSEVVCIADAISVGWSAASRAQVTTKEAPLVIGCGAIGLSAIATLKRLGVGPIMAVDFVASRRETAGGPPEGDHLHTLTAKRKGLNIQFGGGPLMAHWDEAFEAVCSGSLDVTPMLGPTVGLDEVPAALDASRDAHGPARTVVAP